MESPGQWCQTTHDSCGLRTRLNARPAGFADREMLAGCQVADIGHCALPMHIHVEWVKRLEDEFFAQVDPLAPATTVPALTVCPGAGLCRLSTTDWELWGSRMAG